MIRVRINLNIMAIIILTLCISSSLAFSQEETKEIAKKESTDLNQEKVDYVQGISFLGSGFGYSNTEKGIIQIGVNYERLFSKCSIGLGVLFKLVQAGETIGVQTFFKYFFRSPNVDGFYLLAGAAYGKENYDDKDEVRGQSVGTAYQWVFGDKNQKFWGLGYSRIFNPGRSNFGTFFFDFGFRF